MLLRETKSSIFNVIHEPIQRTEWPECFLKRCQSIRLAEKTLMLGFCYCVAKAFCSPKNIIDTYHVLSQIVFIVNVISDFCLSI